MNDQELLTYAAKAAGYIETASVQNGFGFIALAVMDEDGDWTGKDWNPLENDADAFQLMAKCKIDLAFGKGDVESSFTPKKGYFEEGFLDFYKDEQSKMMAARRVIVMAAAEIGKAMK